MNERDRADATGPKLQSSESLGSGQPTWQGARLRRDGMQQAMEHLEETVARPAMPEGWADAVDASLLQLEGALVAHIREVESPDGLLAEIVEEAPRLAAEVETMKIEHLELLRSWARAQQSLKGDGVGSVAEVRRRVVSLLGRLAIHRQRGSDLVYEAYNVDISAAD